ncbi:MAG: hypothetical protein EXS24_02035 [Pedosphaera sp.]|nr:hypothetical protein [Pedosphaera sp.]
MIGTATEYSNTGSYETAQRLGTQSSQGRAGSDVTGDLEAVSLTRQMVAEFIGSFFLVFVGIMTAYLLFTDYLAGALAQGMIAAIMMMLFGGISGAQLNPVVTLALVIGGRLSLLRAMCIIPTQIIAGVLATLVLAGVLGKSEIVYPTGDAPSPIEMATPKIPVRLVNGAPAPNTPRVNVPKAILVEGLLAFVWAMAVAGYVCRRGASTTGAALAVGCAVTAVLLVGGVITGAGLNPARVFGPALISGTWTNHLVYWVGPIVGAVMAGLIGCRFLFREEEE